MAFIKAGINKKPIPELLQIAGVVYDKMKDNPSFPDPLPSLDRLKNDTDKLAKTYKDSLNGGKDLKQLMYMAEDKLRETIMQVSSYVQMISGGNEAIILSSGFGISSPNRKPKPMPTPQNLRLELTDTPGEVLLRWKPVTRSVGYITEFTETGADDKSWLRCDTCTKAKLLVKGLTPGKNYWFRVKALGTMGESAASDPVVKWAM